MKFTKKLIASVVATATVATASFAPTANAEVSASLGIANTYLWRGFELGSGTPVVSGSLDFTSSWGGYAGIWTSSGDTSAGTEYDLYVGWGGEAGDFFWDLSLITYVFPTGQYSETDGLPGDFAEFIGTIGYGPVSFSYYDNIAGETGGYAFNNDYSYMSLGAEFGQFSVALGQHFEDAPVDESVTGDSTHLDLGYAYNDNLAFTLSAIVNSDFDDTPEPTFVVSYSVPIE